MKYSRNDITPEMLREFLDYDPETGILVWKKRNIKWFCNSRVCNVWHTKYSGKRAGTVITNKYGYKSRKIHVLGVVMGEHRIIWAIMTGTMPDFQIDHIDRDATNSIWSNLRKADPHINSHNKSMRIDNKSGINGVSWHKATGKWVAQIQQNNKHVYLGVFDDIEDAKSARRSAEDKLDFHPEHGRSQAIYR